MQLFAPQVQIFHTISANGPDYYYLHVVTFTDQTNLVAAGHHIPSFIPDANDTISVQLFLEEDVGRLNTTGLTPLVHTIDIGTVAFSEEGFFKIELLVSAGLTARGESTTTTQTTKGNAKVSTTSSKSVDR